VLTIISNQENDGKEEGNPEAIREAEDKINNIMAKNYLEDEENEEDFKEDILSKLMAARKDINNLKRENEELKKKAQVDDQEKTRKEVDLIKLQVQERDEDEANIKEEFHQRKRKHHQ